MSALSESVPHVEHYDNGNVRFRGANLGGEMHGPWEFFRSDGSIMRSGLFDCGKQVGVWRTFDRYPPAEATPRRLYLTSAGHAQSSAGDGMLRWQSVADAPPTPDRFTFDPRNPVPGDMAGWGQDRQSIQQRRDVLLVRQQPAPGHATVRKTVRPRRCAGPQGAFGHWPA
jgi:predicted acyl esterase